MQCHLGWWASPQATSSIPIERATFFPRLNKRAEVSGLSIEKQIITLKVNDLTVPNY